MHQQQRPCWNGPDCRFLQQNRCHFYHPPSHYQMNGLYRESESENSWEYEPQISGKNMLYFQNPEVKHQKKKQVPTHIEQDGIKIPLVPVQTNISCPSKAWFFKNTPHFNRPEGSKHEECAICIENYNQNKLITKLFCNHAYHKACIQHWLCENINCPLCKKNFTDHLQYKDMPNYEAHKQPLLNLFNNSFDSYSEDFEDSWIVDHDAGSVGSLEPEPYFPQYNLNFNSYEIDEVHVDNSDSNSYIGSDGIQANNYSPNFYQENSWGADDFSFD